MHNWSKGWALRSLNIGVSIKEETIFTGANYYHFLTLMIAKSKRKKRKRKILSLSFFFFRVEICYSHMSIYQILLSPNYQKQRTKNKGATKTSHKKWKDIVSQFQHSTLFTFFIFYFFFSLLVGVFLVDLIASNIFFNLLLCLLLTT